MALGSPRLTVRVDCDLLRRIDAQILLSGPFKRVGAEDRSKFIRKCVVAHLDKMRRSSRARPGRRQSSKNRSTHNAA